MAERAVRPVVALLAALRVARPHPRMNRFLITRPAAARPALIHFPQQAISPARSSPSSAASDNSQVSTASAGSDSDSGSGRDASPPRAGAGCGSAAGGRACGRDGGAARGRGGRGSRGSRGRGRGRSAARLTTEVGDHIGEDTDSEVERRQRPTQRAKCATRVAFFCD
eukprot:jgi/Tetstr1/428255/TSEL_018294.t1